MKVIDISRRLAKLEARRTSPSSHLSRQALEEMFDGHVAALASEYGPDWEAIYRAELSERCPENLVLWDKVRARQSIRSVRNGHAGEDYHDAK